MQMTHHAAAFAPAALTSAVLCAATGATPARAVAWRVPIAQACAVYGITTPPRLAAFLAQIGHESGRLLYVRELWGPTPAQRRYEGRALIQTTGRANYAATRDGLRQQMPGVPDFEADPQQLEQPQWAALSAAWYWDSRALSELADLDSDSAFLAITRRINGGTNGLADRRALWTAARAALGLGALG